MKLPRTAVIALAAVAVAMPLRQAIPSSHMDAPLITLSPAANTTDVYAFRSVAGGVQYLTTALAVYPFEEPGIGPNNYSFDDRLDYEIHVATTPEDLQAGRATITYRFEFNTVFQNEDTIRQAYLGIVEPVVDGDGFFENQNLRQSYTVTKVDNRTGSEIVLGAGIVPPNNQGLVTPFYNQGNDGDALAKEGVADRADLDPYTQQGITPLGQDYEAFAGQRDDGFYADIQSIFDLDFSFGRATSTPSKPFDSQSGFNVHTIVLNIPIVELEGAVVVGVYATTGFNTSRIRGRQGNPLFVEALVALQDKDRYNRLDPIRDERLFAQYARDPELNRLLGLPPVDLSGLFIPDLIKVDVTTGPARTPNDPNFNRLGIFGGDTLTNAAGDGIPGGWPNGRRFGDDVLDIALIALGVPAPNDGEPDYDRITSNDITYNDVFPYAATPLNGRNHDHH